jgi:hypothetical protein
MRKCDDRLTQKLGLAFLLSADNSSSVWLLTCTQYRCFKDLYPLA